MTAENQRVNEESLAETGLQIAVMIVISLVLCLVVMAEIGVHFRLLPERLHPVKAATVQTDVQKDHAKKDKG